MFAGHYGAAFAARRLEPGAPLWIYFLAVQAVDVLWALAILTGLERMSLDASLPSNPLVLEFMPYTHSLVAAAAWTAVSAGAAGWLGRRSGLRRAGLAVGLAVASHWVLDLPVHRPDLPVYDDTWKLGLGLWNFPMAALTLELGVLAAGIAWAWPVLQRRRRVVALAAALAALQAGMLFAPPPESVGVVAVSVLAAFGLLAALAAWAEPMGRASSLRISPGPGG